MSLEIRAYLEVIGLIKVSRRVARMFGQTMGSRVAEKRTAWWCGTEAPIKFLSVGVPADRIQEYNTAVVVLCISIIII